MEQKKTRVRTVPAGLDCHTTETTRKGAIYHALRTMPEEYATTEHPNNGGKLFRTSVFLC